jgi:HEAT repeat protein
MLFLLLALALHVPVVWPVPPPAGDPEIAEARQLFSKLLEADARKAAKILAAENSVPAVKLLLEMLGFSDWDRSRHLAPAHFRDIAWGALVQITDPYARRVVETWLRAKDEDEHLREWCVRLIGVWKEDAFGAVVLDHLDHENDAIRREAALALGRLKYAPVSSALEKLVRHRDPVLRANAIEALARIDPAGQRKTFEKGLSDKDGGVRCALLGAVPAVFPADVEALSVPRLDDEDWRPRIQAVENLASVRTKTAVDALLTKLEDGRPVVAARAIDSLRSLTGEKLTRPDQWRSWWRDHRATFTFPEGRTARTHWEDGRSKVAYNGIPVTSDHVAFLIDKSKAMKEPLASKGCTKTEAAQQELDLVLTKLVDAGLVFNVFTYNERVDVFAEKKPVELGKKTRREALDFVAARPIDGLKDIWQALETVVSDPTLDTIYLLSSGEPETGLYVHWNRVTDHLADLNRFHKVVVHTVAYSDNAWYRDQLLEISKATGGRFHYFE